MLVHYGKNTCQKGCSCNKCQFEKESESQCVTSSQINESFPPPAPQKKGADVFHGDVVAHNIKAITVASQPKIFFIPGDFPTLGDAFKFLSTTNQPEPTKGYKIVLKKGTHHVATDLGSGCSRIVNGKCVGNTVKNLTIEAQSWVSTMSHGYIQGTGLHDKAITCVFDQHADKESGLGPWDLEICGSRITVRGSKNPDFRGLECDDDLFFRTKTGTILCHKVEKASCNTIFIRGCFGVETDENGCPEEGEGFWIGNRAHVKMKGTRKVQTQNRLEWIGINLAADECHSLATGATSGAYQLRSCNTENVIKAIGKADNLYPNVHLGTISRSVGDNGINLYQSFLGYRARYFGQGSAELLLGSVFAGNEIGMQLEGGSKIGGSGSSFTKCKVGCESTGSILDYAGCRMWRCDVGLSGLTAHFHSINRGIESLIDTDFPIFVQCDIGLRIDDKGHGKNETIRTSDNNIDLRIDGKDYPNLNSYPSGNLEAKVSAIYYDEHIEEKEKKSHEKKSHEKKSHKKKCGKVECRKKKCRQTGYN
uniref:Beta-helix protein n=1 Tax=Pithovirus LCPAC201 TaxID=2506591 RepID=A0A481Z4E1_9VIRU|nr:MAG: beta-helix protein [Pithovirus LCPAC201]